jgi:hypothetical protein
VKRYEEGQHEGGERKHKGKGTVSPTNISNVEQRATERKENRKSKTNQGTPTPEQNRSNEQEGTRPEGIQNIRQVMHLQN